MRSRGVPRNCVRRDLRDFHCAADRDAVDDLDVGPDARRLLARDAERRLARRVVRYLTGDLDGRLAAAHLRGRREQQPRETGIRASET